MNIHLRHAVTAAYQRALALNPDTEEAIDAVAQSLGLAREAVVECVEGVEA